ncbi:WD40 repeat-like protein [Perkinsela sp. CCAP 1560/4]|nr:WD40 repeat-like protein [Perkinsela sp. CCAP 1560/4]|eukprot:KNH07158.1 WD40 repeat-like protein [Perkinsela sp. CCAP 1560/4]
MPAPINAVCARRELESREKLVQIKKEREDVKRLYEKYSQTLSKVVSVPPSRRLPKKKMTKESAIQQCLCEELFHRNFSLFEVTCGGEIIWTTSEKSIDIQSVHGEVLHSFPIEGVTAIGQSSDRVWFGSLDGTVRVFDKYDFSCLLTCDAHSNAVNGFTSGIGEAFYSCSEDGTVVEWCDDGECVRKVIVLLFMDRPISRIDCYGFRLFVVSANKYLEEYDAETGFHVRHFQTSEAPIRELMCINGYLFTLQREHLAVWNINDGSRIREIHGRNHAKFVCVFGDTYNGNIVALNDGGGMSIYGCRSTDNFQLLTEIDDIGCANVSALKGVSCTQRLKVLISYKDGRNTIVSREKSIQRRDTSAALSIIKEKHHASSRLLEEAEKASIIQSLRKEALSQSFARALERKSSIAMLRRVYTTLLSHLNASRRVDRLLKLANVLSLKTTCCFVMPHFRILERSARVARKTYELKRNRLLISRMTHRRALMYYWEFLKESGRKSVLLTVT